MIGLSAGGIKPIDAGHFAILARNSACVSAVVPCRQPMNDQARDSTEDPRMMRRRALQILLVLAGLTCLAGLYPLIGALRDGTATTINRQDQMILGIYIVLGVFLLIAARDPRTHRSLILFAGWSTIAHDSVMIVQGIQHHDLRADLIGFGVIAVIGLALIALARGLPAQPQFATSSA
jgi:drug/metabolite transporter superfamily protein YnfA